MKKQVTSVSIMQSAKIVTALYALMGFIYTLVGIPMIIFGTSTATRIIGIFYTAGPVLFAVVGFIFFVIFAALYNLLAKSLGGIELELKDVEEVGKAPLR
jgi:hypothetical protein